MTDSVSLAMDALSTFAQNPHITVAIVRLLSYYTIPYCTISYCTVLYYTICLICPDYRPLKLVVIIFGTGASLLDAIPGVLQMDSAS